jgi:hypothetical protein
VGALGVGYEDTGAFDQSSGWIATKGANACGCGGMVDAADSKSASARSVGSSPTTRTNYANNLVRRAILGENGVRLPYF